MNWSSVCKEASKYVESLELICPQYLEEIKGLADGANVDLLDILALNVRTEITFGLFTDQVSIPMDGCTSLAMKTETGKMLLAQNWDWHAEQSPNLVICHISQPNIPAFSMVTEAGLIGKIGFNERGVGVCFNAIRARGVNPSKLPAHLGLRAVLESTSREAAVDKLKSLGIAGSAYISVADETGATGLECTSGGIKDLEMTDHNLQRLAHSNHLIIEHPEVNEPPWLPDSRVRLNRFNKLLDEQFTSGTEVTVPQLFEIFKDEEGYPSAINRCQKGESDTETLFNIIMELSERRATVTFGRPTEQGEVAKINFRSRA